jgi:ABC-type phosphate transport system substrate-binding protein
VPLLIIREEVLVNLKLVATAAATVLGFAATDVTTQAVDARPVQCPGVPDTVATNGSSLQYNGVNAVATAYNGANGPCSGGVFGGGGTVQVAKGGSGLCVAEMTSHVGQITSPNTAAANFCGTTIPYVEPQWAAASAGSGTNASALQTIPLAVEAIAVSYNVPCAGTSLHITGAQLSAIYSGRMDDWNTLTSACPVGTPIKAGVYGVPSGATAAFKSYLFKSDPVFWGSQMPPGAYLPPDPSTNWPAALTKTCNATNDTDMPVCGSNGTSNIVYLGFSTASRNGLVDAAVTNANPTQFSTPSAGSCTAAATAAVTPQSTFADWSRVTITDGPVGYGICTFTYALAFEAPVTAGMATPAQAPVVRAFIGYEVSDAGQAIFTQQSYDPLPLNVQAMAQLGASLLTSN